MDDEHSRSAGLSDDIRPGTHLVLVSANDEAVAQHALEVAELCAQTLGIVLEVEEP